MTLAPGAMLGKTYRVVRWIGGGGMGDVYEVAHERLAGRYAAKVLSGDFASHPDAFSRFKREAMITSGLRHPGIVQVIDFDRADEGYSYLVMELLEGQELATIIQRSAPVELARAVGLVEQIGSALEAAHRQGIVHRDLKPQNVFVLPLDRGRELVKILDFGISKAQVTSQKLTKTAAVIGTPQYMAPEQARGGGAEVDARADQFALAAITYELLSGRPAFSGDSVVALIYQVVHVDPPPLGAVAPHLPPAIDTVIRRGLAKQPEARYRDISGFTAALLAVASEATPRQAGGSGSVPHPTEASAASWPAIGRTKKLSTTLSASAAQVHPAPPARRRSATAYLLAAAAVSVAGAAIWLASVRRPTQAGASGDAAGQSRATVVAPVTSPHPSVGLAPRPSSVVPSPEIGTPSPTPSQPEPTLGASNQPEGAVVPTRATAAGSSVTDSEASHDSTRRDRRRRRSPAKAGTTIAAPERPRRDELINDL
jgi:serine/threonine protein kinase